MVLLLQILRLVTSRIRMDLVIEVVLRGGRTVEYIAMIERRLVEIVVAALHFHLAATRRRKTVHISVHLC